MFKYLVERVVAMHTICIHLQCGGSKGSWAVPGIKYWVSTKARRPPVKVRRQVKLIISQQLRKMATRWRQLARLPECCEMCDWCTHYCVCTHMYGVCDGAMGDSLICCPCQSEQSFNPPSPSLPYPCHLHYGIMASPCIQPRSLSPAQSP